VRVARSAGAQLATAATANRAASTAMSACQMYMRARRRGGSPGPADGPDFPRPSSPTEEPIAAIGLEPRDVYSRRHLHRLQNLPGSRIDSAQIALITLPGAVPKLSVDPGDAGDEAVGLDRPT